MRITVRVPATSANLGPGFDCFGLALDLCNEVTVDTEAQPEVTWEGEGADELPVDGTDMVSRAIAHAFEVGRRRFDPGPIPSFHLRSVNRIPLAAGLGSSAAAGVAGTVVGLVFLAEGRREHLDRDPVSVIPYASRLEGHADNAAAAVLGGFTIVASGFPYRLDPHPDLDPVVLTPQHVTTSTEEARVALAPEVKRPDAVFNIGHASLTVTALTNDPDLLAFALDDRMHEESRLASVPDGLRLLRELRGRKIAACVSGAGPSLLAFPRVDDDIELPDGWRSIRPGVRAAGVEFEVEA
ncbi:MAG TPA: homoserine kinase [Actinomycetota bacterium]|nr:homoserine kinase [Actinomycetota bacterium]